MNYAMILVALLCMPLLHAMEDNNVQQHGHNTYKGQVITAENLLDLLPAMPEDMKNELDDWIKQPHNKPFVQILAETSPIVKHDIFSMKEDVQLSAKIKIATLENLKKINLSKHNYNFRVDKLSIIKISGLISRLRTLYKLTTGNDPYHTDFWSYPFEQMTTRKTPTFQHASTGAHYLRALEIIDKEKMQHLHTVPTYLYGIADQQNAPCCDEHYICVQPAYDNPKFGNGTHDIKQLESLPEREITSILSSLPNDAFKELHTAIQYAALWNPSGNLLIDTKKPNEIWYSDLEQPNNSGPFFYEGAQGYNKYLHDCSVGIFEMSAMIRGHAPEKYEMWQSFSKKRK